MHHNLDTVEMMEVLSVSSSGTPLNMMNPAGGSGGGSGSGGGGDQLGSHGSFAGYSTLSAHGHGLNSSYPGLHGSALHSSMYTSAAMGNMMASHSHSALANPHPHSIGNERKNFYYSTLERPPGRMIGCRERRQKSPLADS